MEVKPGYKQTEIGVIPEDWEVSSLQQACRETITYGIVQCGPHIRDGVPYIRVSDMDEPELTADAMLRTSKSIASKFARSTVEEGDLVYALRGKLGEVRQIRAELAGANLTQGTARLSPNDRLASDYLVWAMRNPRTVRQAELEAKGTTFREITLADLRRIKVLVPPKPEQRAIAMALSDVDALLGRLDRLIAKKRDLKQAAMQQLLTGGTRLPGFHGEWETVSLEQLALKATGVWGAQYANEGHPRYADIIRAGDISPNGELTGTAPRYLSDTDFAKASCRLDDLVITTSGNGLGKVWWCDGRANVAASNFVRILRPIKQKAQGRFLSYVLRSGEALRQLREHTATSAYPNLRPTFFSAPWIALPAVPEQTAIAEVLTDMDAELAALEQRREKTRALKQAMMQELLTGRTRLV